MIAEVAEITVKAGLEPEFERGIAAAALFLRSTGWRGLSLQRVDIDKLFEASCC